MSTDPGAGEGKGGPTRAAVAAEARALVRAALKGSLGTLRGPERDPYVSLVTVATTPDGAPLMLLSGLAVHTKNLAADARASLLVDATSLAGDPLAGGRVSLLGTLARAEDQAAAGRRFLARHPAASQYAGFGDFAYYRMAVAGAHFIGGFGRIVDLGAGELATDIAGAEALAAAEAEILAHMAEDHAEAVALYATRLAGKEPGSWRMSGIDPDGIDLMDGERTARVRFAAPVRTPGEARRALAALAARARQAG